MISWLDAELKSIQIWASNHLEATEDANHTPIGLISEYYIYHTWNALSLAFDYELDPVDATASAPCRQYATDTSTNAIYNYITVNGLVVHGSKINNILWALFGRYWGWSETSLRVGAQYNQITRNHRLDGETSQNAIGLAADLFMLLQSNATASVTTVLTAENLSTLIDAVDLNEEHLWPATAAADTAASTFDRPTLPTTP